MTTRTADDGEPEHDRAVATDDRTAVRTDPQPETRPIPGPLSGPMLTAQAQRSLEAIDGNTLEEMRRLRDDTDRFFARYRYGMEEVVTKLEILRDEFSRTHDYNPIEHLSSRLKSLDSVVAKLERKGVDPTFESIAETITDIAGVRVTCSFISDVYRVFELLVSQPDLTVRKVKDYIAEPKPNGYQSLHLIVEVPVFLSTGAHPIPVEVQIRTSAMDFWASLEHKIYYKYDRQVPDELLEGLTEAAHTAAELDARMERLHRSIHGVPAAIALEPPIGAARPPELREGGGAVAI